MNQKFLLPNRFRNIGWIILLPSIVLGVAAIHWEFEFDFLEFSIREAGFLDPQNENFTNEIAGIGALIGLMFIAFSKDRIEDEFTSKLRLESLQVAVIINYALLFLAILFVYSLDFFLVLVYNMYTILIFFIIRYYWVKYRQNRMLT